MRHCRVPSVRDDRVGAGRLDVIVFAGLVFVILMLAGAWFLQTKLVADRKLRCKNNLMQWGLALHNYHDVHRCFPPYAGGMLENGERLSGSVMLLPFLDQFPLWNQIATTPGQGGDPLNLALASKPTREFEIFVCPSASIPFPVDGQPHLSYAFCVGDQIDFGSGAADFPNQEKTRGAFGWRHCRTVHDILDGTSNTIFMAERDLSNPRSRRDVLGRVAAVPATSPADCLATSAKGEYLASTPLLTELMGERWSSGHPFYAVFMTALPPNGPSCAASASPSGKSVGGWFTASSSHPDGCHLLMGDGAVRFVNETIDIGNLKATQPGDNPGQPYLEKDKSSYGVWGMLGTIDTEAMHNPTY